MLKKRVQYICNMKIYRKICKNTMVGILLVLLIVILFGCSAPAKPADTVMEFETAYNNGDLSGMLDCMDPLIAKGIKAGMSLVGGLIDINLNDIADLIPILYKFSDGLEVDGKNLGDSKPNVEFTITDTEIDGNESTVSFRAVLSKDGQEKTYDSKFYMKKVDRKWYITGSE
jgi:hypothetical protein